MSEDEWNFSGRDWRDLSPRQWTEARHEIHCRAHLMRSQAARELLAYVFGALLRMLRFIRDRYASLKTAQIERNAVSRLQALDDRTLKDLGIRRSEIESVVHGKGCDATRRRDSCSLAA